jgi:hypothetical protein
MNNATCAIRLAGNFGMMRDACFLENCVGIRASRTQLLATGQHIDLSTLAEQTGYRIHVFFRHDAFERLTDNTGRFSSNGNDLYAAMLSMREALMKAPLQDCPVLFQVGDVALVANFGRVDHDDPRRAITVALASPDED